MAPASLDVSLAAFAQLEADRTALETIWAQRLERADYEVDQARRRYRRWLGSRAHQQRDPHRRQRGDPGSLGDGRIADDPGLATTPSRPPGLQEPAPAPAGTK
jgi:hypothetical protein